MRIIITLAALLVFSSGYFINESSAEVSENQAFFLEGSGFAVNEESIRISEIDLGLSSHQKHGSTIDFLTEDGFITLDDEEFLFSNLEGKFLREGRYIRINGDVESSTGVDTSVSFFGRIIEESKNATVYGFTGKIATPDDTYKIIYTTKLSAFSKVNTTITSSEKTIELTTHIFKGSSSKTISKYFSHDRISVQPGTTITITNDDTTSHNIISGIEHRSRDKPFSPDGRISSGDIAPGESVRITFDDLGFYRLYDPNYTWITTTAYVFPDSNSLILGTGKNLGN